eukprot:UN02636
MGCICDTGHADWKQIIILDVEPSVENASILFAYLRNNGNLRSLWNTYKINENEHHGMEYPEFEQLLIATQQIFDNIRGSCCDVDIGKIQRKIIAQTPQKMEQIKNMVKETGPKLAVKFDKDGDGIFSYNEFKEIAEYIKQEYNKKCSTVTVVY